MSTATEKKPPRKFPPPCWTQDEALALIEAYRERWYALRRGYLRTADWDAVAAAVGQRFPGSSPAKTSAQCRHKMEKLRQRYRVEKQRSLSSYPGRFFSSWFFFESMDAMEHGSPSTVGSNQENRQNLVTIGFYSKNSEKIDGNSNSSPGFNHEGVDPAAGFRIKASPDRNSGAKSRVSKGSPQYLDFRSDDDDDEGDPFGGEFHVKNPINGSLIPQGYRANKSAKIYKNSTARLDSSHGEDDGVDFNGGCRLNTQIEQDFGFRAKKSNKFNHDWDDGSSNRVDANGDFWVKVSGDRNRVSLGVNGNRNLNSNFDPMVPVFGSRRGGAGGGGSGGGVKRGRGSVAEMVASIKLLGEGFVEMEKKKMEMVKEIEKMRMEMEMKRNELLMKSQQQIVDAFVEGLFDGKKKVNAAVSLPDS